MSQLPLANVEDLDPVSGEGNESTLRPHDARPPVCLDQASVLPGLGRVFYSMRLGFPHPSAAGARALALLRANAISAVPVTARSIGHVSRFCRIYGLPGGIAECGGVFFDAVNGREHPLIGSRDEDQMKACREAIRELPGVFLHSACRHIVRAYRCHREAMVPVDVDEVTGFLHRHGLDLLCAHQGSGYTDVVPQRSGKARGLSMVKSLVGCADMPAAAIGDSDADVEMLDSAEFSYAPANCSIHVRELAQKGRCRLLAKPHQRALLTAAQESILRLCPDAERAALSPADLIVSSDLVHELMEVADRPRWRQLLSLLRRRQL